MVNSAGDYVVSFIVARFVAQFSWNTNVVGSDDPMDTKHFVLTLF